MSLTREQALLEYAKCVNDTPYALKTYLQTYDNTQSQYSPYRDWETERKSTRLNSSHRL